MNQVNVGSKLGQKHRLLTRGVAPADHTDRDVSIERPIASRARSQAVTLQPFLICQPEPLSGRATGHNQTLRFQPLAVDLETVKVSAGFEFVDLSVAETSAKFLRLPVHVHDQLRAINPVGESGEILDQRGRSELAAWFTTFQDEGRKVCPGRIDRGGQAGATRTPDDDTFDGAVTFH